MGEPTKTERTAPEQSVRQSDDAVSQSRTGLRRELSQVGYEAGRARVSVATSIQGYRTTYPDPEKGGALTQQLTTLLGKGQTGHQATDAIAAGSRTPGSGVSPGEETAGMTSGTTNPNAATTKHALVVGNSDYADTGTMGSSQSALRDLGGSAGDATRAAAGLQSAGYAVRQKPNLTAAQLESEARTTLGAFSGVGSMMFYFSGHGIPEGLVGTQGKVWSPAQANALSNTAQSQGIELDLAFDACHAGVFADAIRKDELGEVATGLSTAAGGATGTKSTAIAAARSLVTQALAIQSAKDRFTADMWSWWKTRFEIEARMESEFTEAVATEWETHYAKNRTIWASFVRTVKPLVTALQRDAKAASVTVPAARLLPAAAKSDGQGVEQEIQSGLDDLDSVTQAILSYAQSVLQ